MFSLKTSNLNKCNRPESSLASTHCLSFLAVLQAFAAIHAEAIKDASFVQYSLNPTVQACWDLPPTSTGSEFFSRVFGARSVYNTQSGKYCMIIWVTI